MTSAEHCVAVAVVVAVVGRPVVSVVVLRALFGRPQFAPESGNPAACRGVRMGGRWA